MTINNILFYIITLLASTSLLYTWFKSSLPALTFTILKVFGLKRKDPNFWVLPSDLSIGLTTPRSPLTWTLADWAGSESSLGFAQERLGSFLGELLTCRFCLCYHIVLWVNLVSYLVLYICFNDYAPMFIVTIAAIISQPILVHLLFNIVESFSAHN